MQERYKMIIGICGFKGSGKDTLASFLCDRGFKKLSMSDPLKDAISDLFNWDRFLLQGDSIRSRKWRETPDSEWEELAGKGIFKEDNHITPRLVLQKVGSELFRDKVHPDFWVLCMKKRIAAILKEASQTGDNLRGIVIPDIRFSNEVQLCDYVVRITRPTDPKDVSNLHISETEHLKFKYDLIVNNNGAIYDLEKYADDILLHSMNK